MKPPTPNAGRLALDTIAPYANSPTHTALRYPGRRKLWLAALGNRVTVTTIKLWRLGHDPMPNWARDMLANHLRREIIERQQVVDELTKEKGAP